MRSKKAFCVYSPDQGQNGGNSNLQQKEAVITTHSTAILRHTVALHMHSSYSINKAGIKYLSIATLM